MGALSNESRRIVAALPGHYRLVEDLGVGGMGQVFKAVDVRLNRAVAIKTVNREHLGPEGSSRLRAEALAAASLNHPYICKIYELIDGEEDTFVVMEFIDGETLSARLKRGPLPLADAVKLGAEVAEGLADAHDHGLVHRDVKPSNVILTPNGHIKLLDFGLAHPDMGATEAATTHTSPHDGPLLGGTPQYMAPEQATGGGVTARTDLFSLGSLLFECLTGRLPFDGETSFDYVRHMLADAPRPLYRLAPDAPDALAKLIDDCLEKTPFRRPPSARVVVEGLRHISHDLHVHGAGAVTVRAVRARRRRTMFFLAGGAAVILSAAIVLWWGGDGPGLQRDFTQRRLTTSSGEESQSRLSPDGSWVSYRTADGLFLQSVALGQANATSVTRGNILSHVWSPDGTQFAVLVGQGSTAVLHVLPRSGGSPIGRGIEVPTPNEARLLRWISRTVYLSMRPSSRAALYAVDLDGPGEFRNLSQAWTVDGTLMEFDVSPDGTRVVFSVEKEGRYRLWVSGLDGKSAEPLTPDDEASDRHPIWTALGDAVVYQSSHGGQFDLWEISVATRTPRQLTTSPEVEIPNSTAPDGSISFQRVLEERTLWLHSAGAAGERQLTIEALSDHSPSASRDGAVVAFQRSLAGPAESSVVDSDLLVGRRDASGALPAPRLVAVGLNPVLSPDGRALAYFQALYQNGRWVRSRLQITRLDVTGTVTLSTNVPVLTSVGFPKQVVESYVVWRGSGEELFYVEQHDGFRVRRYRIGAEEPVDVVHWPAADKVWDLSLSPDGQRLACLTRSKDDKVAELHVWDLATGRDTVLARLPVEKGYRVPLLRGWLPSGQSVVLVLQMEELAGPSALRSIEIVRVDMDRQRTLIKQLEHALAPTTRLLPDRGEIFVTRSMSGVPNLYAVALATGKVRVVTGNADADVAFGGISPLGPDHVVVVHDKRKKDIWMLDASTTNRRAHD